MDLYSCDLFLIKNIIFIVGCSQEILDFIEFDVDGNFYLADPELESDLLKAHSE